MQTAVVAGGAGFIGSYLVEKLLEENFQVICIDNLITGSKDNISTFLTNPNFKFIQEDVANSKFSPRDEAGKILASRRSGQNSKIDCIFHLASPASPNQHSPRSYMSFPIETLLVNSVGTYNLLEIAKKNKARFVFASTSEVYGDPTVSPQPESYFGNVNPNGIRSVYDEGKRFGEAITMAYYRKYKLGIRIARIFNTYGPRMQYDDGRVVSNFITQALENKPITVYGDGNQTRSFCYVSDMVEGLYKLMFTDTIDGEVINLGNPSEKRIIDFAAIIKDLIQTNSKIEFRDLPEDDPKQRRPDIASAKKILSWQPETDLEDGLKKTIDYFKALQHA